MLGAFTHSIFLNFHNDWVNFVLLALPLWASLVAQLVKNLPAMWETSVQSLRWEDLLEKGKATSVFWSGEFNGLYSPWSRKESDTTERLSLTDEKTGSEKFSDLLKVIQLISDFGEAHQKPYVGKNVIEFLIFT